MVNQKLSAVIITYNEEKNIARCIQSLSGIADEIIVVDSFSTDETINIASSHGAKVVTNSFKGFTSQKNFALSQCSFDYVLSLDADEYLSPELKTSILHEKNNWRADGYTFNRLNNYSGKWIKSCGWYPDAKIRLWNKTKGQWQGGLLHEVVVLDRGSKQLHLSGDLLHLAYQNASQLISKIQTYSTYYAQEHQYKKSVKWPSILVKTFIAFFKNYIIKGGIWDGYEGFIISKSNANGVLYKYAKLYEKNRSMTTALIITTYNRKDALELVLVSVLRQSVLPNEVIIADDGSRDDTAELIQRYTGEFPVPLIHIWHEDNGFRLSAIRNKAIAKSSSDYIIMVDGDMVLQKNFIADHKSRAKAGRFIQGSRVLLSPVLTDESIKNKQTEFSISTPGVVNRKNLLRSTILSKLFSYYSKHVYRVRGANLSFWKSDLLKVNGFNEDFVGWGREDSEFAVRMYNAGVKRFHLKFMAFGYHLFHPENSREMLVQNQQILDNAIDQKFKRCPNGLDKYVAQTVRS